MVNIQQLATISRYGGRETQEEDQCFHHAVTSSSTEMGGLSIQLKMSRKPDDTNARAYAAVLGIDWSKVKSWREVDGAVEFEME